MADQNRNTPNEEPTSEETLGRRQLLKALAATTGAIAAASMLPGEWAKPVVEAGVLPAHAQVTPQLVNYSVLCDSTPGGGDLFLTEGSIRDIQPRVAVVSGTGPVAGITATMTLNTITGPAPTFDRALPLTAITNASGQALFGDLMVTNPTDGQEFLLVFDFAVPSGTAHAECGVFFFRLT
jgi:hypothetical protein